MQIGISHFSNAGSTPAGFRLMRQLIDAHRRVCVHEICDSELSSGLGRLSRATVDDRLASSCVDARWLRRFGTLPLVVLLLTPFEAALVLS
jgi:hypothetical protein